MYNHVLLATDFSHYADHTAKRAWELANQFVAKLSLVHVVLPVPNYGYPALSDIERNIEEEAQSKLDHFGSRYNVPEKQRHLLMGQVKREILNLAKNIEADAIVIGSHGDNGWSSILGSTSNAILHGADIDVVVVRSKD